MAKLSRLGQYKLVRKLGQGGMGTVFEAIQQGLDRRVALKVLPAAFTRDPVFVERFKREARAAAQLNHPNIVTIYEVGEDRGYHFFSMELVDGPTLRQRLDEQGPLSVEEAVGLMRQAVAGLEHAWNAGIVHRDVKPDNLMLARDATLKLTDLGLAKVREALNTLTRSGAGLGTPYYMSPEQGYDARNVDHRTDIYSLGATFYHLLSGRVPFEGSSPIEVAIKRSTAPLPPLREVRPEVSPAAAAVIEKMLARQREDRYQDATELLEALRSLEPALPDSAGLDADETALREMVPSLIEKLEQSAVSGLLHDQLTLLADHLSRLPRRRAMAIFRDAGRLLGSKGSYSGVERGLTALVSVYLELNQMAVGHEVGLEVIAELPDSLDARHFTAVAALHRPASSGADRGRFLEEALRLESEAQQLSGAERQPNYLPSVSTLAQIHHELWRHARGIGQPEKADSHLRQALEIYERRLRLGVSTFGLVLHALALRDAGRDQEALAQAERACQREWFLREAQELIVNLAEQGRAPISERDEHFRRWSLVACEWPGTSERTRALRSYISYLTRRQIQPELLLRQTELEGREPAAVRAACDRGARPPRDATLTQGSQRIACTLKTWSFDQPQPLVVAGVPALGLFGQGSRYEHAEAAFSEMLFALIDKLRTGQWRKSPELTQADRWIAEHAY